MTPESTDSLREKLVLEINSNPKNRENMEDVYGEIWDTKELSRDFEVFQFLSPFVLVRNKDTSEVGTIMFQHKPRFYFSWKPHDDPDVVKEKLN